MRYSRYQLHCNGHAQRGFTLIELMVVVVVIGILAMITLPSYQNYIKRSQARVASADLVALSAAMENRFQQKLKYCESNACNTSVVLAEVKSRGWNEASANFTISIGSVTPSAYTLTATGKGTMANCTLTLKPYEQDLNKQREVSGSGCGGFSWS